MICTLGEKNKNADTNGYYADNPACCLTGGWKVIIKWFPRSWIQIKTSECIIYIDPSFMSTYFKKYDKTIVFSEAEDDCLPGSLEKGDIILISHIHKDHCKEVTINRLSDENTLVLTPRKYKKEVDDRVKIVIPGSRYRFQDVFIEIVNAYNTDDGNSTKKVHKKGECVGYVINIEDKRIYFSGDTDFIPEMKDIRNIDIAILPIGGTFTMDMNTAIEAVLSIKPKCVLPVHHLKANPMEFKMQLKEKTDTNVILLDIGEECTM
jgi:L-ascorbate metabolism protein UlaG (beta-lactamase superfamily)